MTALAEQTPRKDNISDFAAARFHMVEGQLRPNKVTDRRILDAMGTVPREIFLPPLMAGIAYNDEDIQVVPGRYLMQPMILARMMQEANIQSTDRVLDVAPATGYSIAILGSLARQVFAVESDQGLAMQAVKNLPFLEITNTEIHLSSLTGGWEAGRPYDIIFINGSVEFIPEALLSQLAEGGRLIAVVRQYGPAQAAYRGEGRLYEKINGTVSYRPLFDANVKPLPGFKSPEKFTFA